MPYQSTEMGLDKTACFAWAKGQCTHGDACKFAHEGQGACAKVSAPGMGKKWADQSTRVCLNFRKKGRCAKGDQCPFKHVLGSGAAAAGTSTSAAAASAPAPVVDVDVVKVVSLHPTKPSFAQF